MLAGVKGVEIRHAQDHGLAVDHELLAAVLERSVSDPMEAFGPVASAARDQANRPLVPFDAEAVAVVFDFVEPVGTGRHGLANSREAELEFWQ